VQFHGGATIANFFLKEKRVITDYEIITATRVADLQDRVVERIHQGWQPLGGIAVLHEEDAGSHEPHMVFAQAIGSLENPSFNQIHKAG
jgi:hypothetical protein